MTKLELLSGYEFRYNLSDPNAERNPINFSHTRISLGGQTCSVLSRVAFSGADYSGRTNKIAHHFLLEQEELLSAGPAWMIRQMAGAGHFRTAWNDPPKVLASMALQDMLPESPSDQGRLRGWARLGDPGWGGLLARAFCRNKRVPAYVIFEPGADLLVLFEESLRLLPANMRWNVCFAAYYTSAPPDSHYHWRGVLAGSSAAREMARFPGAIVIDLTRRLLPVAPSDEDEFVEAARAGRVVPTLIPASATRRAARVAEVAGVTIPLGPDDDEHDARRRSRGSEMNDLASAARAAPRSAAPPPHFVMVEKAPPWMRWALSVLAVLVCALLASNAVTLWLLLETRSSAPASGVVPAAPSGLTANAVSATRIDLKWSDMPKSKMGFRIERSQNGSKSWTELVHNTKAGATSHQDTGLSPGTTYTYRLLTNSKAGGVAHFSEASATTPAPPAAPNGLTAKAGSPSQIDLKWSDKSDNETGFKIERRDGKSPGWKEIADVRKADATSHSDRGLSAETTYIYRVRAYNEAGQSDYSREANATTASRPAAPASQGQQSTTGADGTRQPIPSLPSYTQCRLQPGTGTASPMATIAFPEENWGKDLGIRVPAPLESAADERWELLDIPGRVAQRSIRSCTQEGHAVLEVPGVSAQVLVQAVLKRRDDGKEIVLHLTADQVAWRDPKLRLTIRFLVVQVRAKDARKTVRFALRPKKAQGCTAKCGWTDGKALVLLERWHVDVDYPWPKLLHGRPGESEGFSPRSVKVDGKTINLLLTVREQEQKARVAMSCSELDEWLKGCEKGLNDANRDRKKAEERLHDLRKRLSEAKRDDEKKQIRQELKEAEKQREGAEAAARKITSRVAEASQQLRAPGPLLIYDPWDLSVAEVDIELVPPPGEKHRRGRK